MKASVPTRRIAFEFDAHDLPRHYCFNTALGQLGYPTRFVDRRASRGSGLT
jgi:hypothetical protein